MRNFVIAALLASGTMVAASGVAIAQDAAMAPSLSNLSASDYVKLAADADNFEIQSGRLAATRSKREDVRGFAKQVVADHAASGKSLTAALSNKDRKIAAPSTKLSSPYQAKLDLLRKAPKASFDQLYLQQQVEAHQSLIALNQAYAATGTDPSLQQVATVELPVLNRHASALAGLNGGM